METVLNPQHPDKQIVRISNAFPMPGTTHRSDDLTVNQTLRRNEPENLLQASAKLLLELEIC
ncbi:hypothetical protein [Pontiella desulfatans]|uniref:hypothetical protein n=1 Tax=Pontiella desulfatans TaxID=2750659 RepID=UPI00109CE263|nr:hypothetical protein [Pontiella desulfatans]